MSLSAASRSTRPSALRASLDSIVAYLESGNVDSAGKTLRQIISTSPIARSSLRASRKETGGTGLPALSIVTLGARLSLENSELESAVEFAKLLPEYQDRDTQKTEISPTVLHIISGLIDIASYSSLSHAASLLVMTQPELIPEDLLSRFYAADHKNSEMMFRVWSHTRFKHTTTPTAYSLALLLRYLIKKDEFSPVLALISTIMKHHPEDSDRLPSAIPIQVAPQVITHSIKAGATDQSLALWWLAQKQLGSFPPASHTVPTMSIEQAQFFGDAAMTYALIRHLGKISKKKPTKLKRWHRSYLGPNPNYFKDAAEEVYDAFATVHGLNLLDRGAEEAMLRADHYVLSTAIACLFDLDRFTLALDALNTLFRSNQIPDMKDIGIILSALARRHAGRATQILLEAAPARLGPDFHPTPYLYNIVLHHAMLQGRKMEAVRLLKHAKEHGCGSLDPMTMDDLMRGVLGDVEIGWTEELKQQRRSKVSSDEGPDSFSNPRLVEQYHLFKRVLNVLDHAQQQARASTVRLAISTALKVNQPVTAWEFHMRGIKYGILKFRKKGDYEVARVQDDDRSTTQKELGENSRKPGDFGPARPWNIARSLYGAKSRGLLDEDRMWGMIEAMGVHIPSKARVGPAWLDEEMHYEPISMKRSNKSGRE